MKMSDEYKMIRKMRNGKKASNFNTLIKKKMKKAANTRLCCRHSVLNGINKNVQNMAVNVNEK